MIETRFDSLIVKMERPRRVVHPTYALEAAQQKGCPFERRRQDPQRQTVRRKRRKRAKKSKAPLVTVAGVNTDCVRLWVHTPKANKATLGEQATYIPLKNKVATALINGFTTFPSIHKCHKLSVGIFSFEIGKASVS